MYAITHEGKAYSPDGLIKDVEGTPLAATDAVDYNAQLEAQQLAHLKTGPESEFLYMCNPKGGKPWTVTTFLGTEVGLAWVGQRAHTGFGYHTYRRPVTVRIFGTLYHGWFMESSGDYVRLKRAKKQTGKYAATYL